MLMCEAPQPQRPPAPPGRVIVRNESKLISLAASITPCDSVGQGASGVLLLNDSLSFTLPPGRYRFRAAGIELRQQLSAAQQLRWIIADSSITIGTLWRRRLPPEIEARLQARQRTQPPYC
jgi:hypothetical protein